MNILRSLASFKTFHDMVNSNFETTVVQIHNIHNTYEIIMTERKNIA